MLHAIRRPVTLGGAILAAPFVLGGYTNFEVSQVHPIDLVSTAAGPRLLALNTPDAMLEVFAIAPDDSLVHEKSISVGLEPVSVVVRSGSEAWVVNQLSDSVSIIDLAQGVVVRTLTVGDEPTDVAFAAGKAFVSVAGEDSVRVFDLGNLDAPSIAVPIFSVKPRALAVSPDGTRVYAVALFSGNQTTVVPAGVIWGTGSGFNLAKMGSLGFAPEMACTGTQPIYPRLPAGIERNPALPVELDSEGEPRPRRLSLIVRWNDEVHQWQDEFGTDWNSCVRQRLPDDDLFVIDAGTLGVTTVAHLGTSLFDVSVNPASGKIYVPNTDARNLVRFEHPLGLQGHVVDNLLSVVDPANGWAVTRVDLNAHVNRASDPATNLVERQASVSQPGMLVWNQAGTAGYMTALGSGKVFRVNGACTTGACIFGPNRATPRAADVGEGPSGVVLDEPRDRLFVLNRISNSITVVRASTLARLAEVPLHDAAPELVRAGRRFLYEAAEYSAHGDAACSTCHISGDRDGLAWELGNPEGDFIPYTGQGDNVRFIVPGPFRCEDLNPSDPFYCAAHDGFDPQKGPMVTRTLRGMLEPLHARGDRPTFNDFNEAFVTLLGSQDVGPVNGKRAGLDAQEMEAFRQFALGIEVSPNPLRPKDDSFPDTDVPVPGTRFSGNPSVGAVVAGYANAFGRQGCDSCHTLRFGAAGGHLGGVVPSTPTALTATALVSGDLVEVADSDIEVPDLRHLTEKIGAQWNTQGLARSGYGLGHDGSVPDIGTFLSRRVFDHLNYAEVSNLAAFMMLRFPIDPRPAVGTQVTVPAGAPPTGTAADEALLGILVGNETAPPIGDLGYSGRQCELVVSAPMGGRVRRFHYANREWVPDLVGEAPLGTTALRETATGPLTFLCTPLGSGIRLGGDRDEDGTVDGSDCAAADAAAASPPVVVTGLAVAGSAPTTLTWVDQQPIAGAGVGYDVLDGSLDTLRAEGVSAATECLASGLASPTYTDEQPDPASGTGRFYVVRAGSICGTGSSGPGRDSLSALVCPP